MTAPDVQIDPDTVDQIGDQLLALADAVRATTAAAEVDTLRPDAPAGFAATAAANGLWAGWSRQLDQTATETAVFGHNVRAAAGSWRGIETTNAALFGGG